MRPPVRALLLSASQRPLVDFDFLRNLHRVGGTVGGFTTLPGVSVVRASTGYAATAAGLLVLFAAGVPRHIIDQGLLVEEARTNLLLQSQTFGTTWTAAGSTPATVTADFATAPDGTLTADKIGGVGDNSDRIQQTLSVLASTTYTLSCFIQNIDATVSKMHVAFPNSGVALQAYVTWSGGVPTISVPDCVGTAYGVEPLGSTGIYRLWATATSNGSDAGTATVRIYPQGSAAAAAKYVNAWGAQLEVGAYRSSYIPTTTAAATRAADVITVGGLSQPAACTMFCEASFPSRDGVSMRPCSFSDGSSSNRVVVARNTSNQGEIFSVGGGSDIYDGTVNSKTGALTMKWAVSWDGQIYRGAIDGVGVTSGAGAAPVGMNTMTIGTGQSGDSALGGYVRKALLLPLAETVAQMQGRTL